nr:type IV toxin-antitoxin system AbiEi family antitoxin [Candidatus Dependentiae bacterium]
INRMKKQGDIISPARGFYVIVPPERQPYGSISADELTPLLMEYLEINYYVSLLSAAALYGASHQKIRCFQVVTDKQIKHPLVFGQVVVQILYKKSLKHLPTRDFTVSTGYLKVATPELVAFDLFHYRRKSGGLNHIATVLAELVEEINAQDLIYLADQIKEKAWIQRLGFILEKLGNTDNETALHLSKELLIYLENKALPFVPLASELPKKGYPRSKTWRIIENTTIESDV